MAKAGIELYYDKMLSNIYDQLKLALKYGIRTDNNKSIVYIMYAQLYGQLNKPKEARYYLQKAKEIPHKKELNIGIENMEKELSKSKTNINS